MTAFYAGTPILEWGGGDPDGAVLVVDLSEESGLRVIPRPVV